MSIKINFDATLNPEEPTLVLAKRNGKKMGALDAHGIVVKGAMTDSCEIQFEMYKYLSDGETLTNLWYSVIDFRLIWCKEWDMWFELTVDLDEDVETRKTISCTQLGDAELSQIMLYDIHINDEDDILRDDYEIPTVLYDPDHPEASLLNRITEHAPHYYIRHVDTSIMNIQRTFTFDSESIKDAFNEIAEEIECLFVLPSDTDENGNINRAIDVYDLDSVCKTCGHRGDYTDKCPECGSTNISEGYGKDTTIFISAEELANTIQFGTDTAAVKNCFKLEGGDDLMTATIRNCNPNGSDRIWYITEQTKADMSEKLLAGLAEYDELYTYYQEDYVVNVPSSMIEEYNNLVTKYRQYSTDIEYIPSEIVGYPALMEAYYDTIDFALYLQSTLMPDASMSDTTAEKEAAKLTYNALNNVAVADVSSISTSTANNAVLAMAKVIVDSRYQVKVNEGSLGSGQRWTGNFRVTNYSDEDDTALSSTITITITDDYEEYLYQMIEKELNNDEVNDMSITYLFMEMTYDEFCAEIKKYCLDSLNMFWNAGQACLDILIEQGIADKATWGSEAAGAESNLYEKLYLPYYEKQEAIEAEIKLREDEIAVILGTYDTDGMQDKYGLQTYLIDERNMIQKALDFEGYLGTDLWLEFSAFRREDKYSNSNYISDGLDNAELFSRAWEFFEKAQEEIYKSAELQHSISTSLRNLLVIDKFAPLIDYFECGNWLRIRVDDSIYKLRLIEYEIDYDSIGDLSVEFSDVMKTLDGLSDKQDLISKMGSISSSYDAVEHQATQGSKALGTLDGWSLWGLDVDNVKLVQSADNETQSWDEHGMLFKKYDPITDTYSDEQLKIIHSTMVITDDNWETVKTAVGGFYYYDPANDYQLTYAYGVNGEVIVGQLILGEQLGIYNNGGTLTFDENGLMVTNGTNTFTVDPNSKQLLVLSKGNTQIFYVDENGNATFSGALNAASGTFTGELVAASGTFTGELVAATGSFSGKITAYEGEIGGFTIGQTALYNGKSSFSSTSSGVYLGTNGIALGDGFSVTEAGYLVSYKGTIGGWTISKNNIKGGSEEMGTTAMVQIPRESESDTRYWVFASGGYDHNDHGDCRFRVGSDGEVCIESDAKASIHSLIELYQGEIDATSDYVSVNGYHTELDIRGGVIDLYADGTSVSTSPIGAFRIMPNLISGYVPNSGNTYWLSLSNTNQRVSITGTLYVNGSEVTGSDEQLKANIQTLSANKADYEKVFDTLKPITFDYKIGGGTHTGFTYQNAVEALKAGGIDPDESALVKLIEDEETGESFGGIDYTNIIALLVNEVQKLKSEMKKIKSA